jgi:hypothetical protein
VTPIAAEYEQLKAAPSIWWCVKLTQEICMSRLVERLFSKAQISWLLWKKTYKSPQQSWWKFIGNGGGNLQGARLTWSKKKRPN